MFSFPQLEVVTTEIVAQAAEYADLSAKFIIQLDTDFKTGGAFIRLIELN